MDILLTPFPLLYPHGLWMPLKEWRPIFNVRGSSNNSQVAHNISKIAIYTVWISMDTSFFEKSLRKFPPIPQKNWRATHWARMMFVIPIRNTTVQWGLHLCQFFYVIFNLCHNFLFSTFYERLRDFLAATLNWPNHATFIKCFFYVRFFLCHTFKTVPMT